MEEDEELKNQCFGGDYSGEVFDHMMKRMSFRRQKRWWNAYILFYTQNESSDVAGTLSTKLDSICCKLFYIFVVIGVLSFIWFSIYSP